MHLIARLLPLFALPSLACGSLSLQSENSEPSECRAHAAVAEALALVSIDRAKKGKLHSLRVATALLHDVDDARTRHKACEATYSREESKERLSRPEPPATVADAPALDDGWEVIDKVWSPGPPSDAASSLIDTTAVLSPDGVVHVQFLDGDRAGQQRIEGFARLWSTHCREKGHPNGLAFHFYDGGGHALDGAPAASGYEVRITFAGKEYWSVIGSNLPGSGPTMQLGGLDRSSSQPQSVQRTVIHEFGHALGMTHEHRRKEVVDCLDRTKTIDYYGKPPNKWDKEKVDKNILTPADSRYLASLDFDPLSIMNYVFPKQLARDPNCKLPEPAWLPSEQDCEAVAYMYPPGGQPVAPVSQSGSPFKTEVKEVLPDFRGSGRTFYRWKLTPNLGKAAIESVEYQMEPYLLDASGDPADKFSLTRIGWGTFPIHITVKLKNSQEIKRYTYYPELGSDAPAKGGSR